MSKFEKQARTTLHISRVYSLGDYQLSNERYTGLELWVPLEVTLADKKKALEQIQEAHQKHLQLIDENYGKMLKEKDAEIQKLQDSKLALSLTQIEHIAKLEGQIAEIRQIINEFPQRKNFPNLPAGCTEFYTLAVQKAEKRLREVLTRWKGKMSVEDKEDIILEDIIQKIMSITRKSEHCEGKIERVIAFDHTGYLKWKCDCGHVSDWSKI